MILITGCSGYIPKNLIKTLERNKYEYLGVSTTINNEKIKKVSFLPNTNWSKLLKKTKVIIHLAGIAHKNNANKKEYEDFYLSTKNLLNQINQSNVEKFIYLSSSGVMGKGSIVPYTIFDKPNPQNIYANNKLLIENEIIKRAQNGKFKYVIIRSPIVYGFNSPGNFKKLASLVRWNLPVPLKNFNNKISMINIKNLNDLIIKSMLSESVNNKILLVSDNQDIKVNKIIIKLIKVYKSKTKIFNINIKFLKACLYLIGKKDSFEKLYNPLRLDISETVKLLNWNPIVNIDESFEDLIDKK